MFLLIQGRAMLMWLCAQLVLQHILVFMDLGRGFGAIALSAMDIQEITLLEFDGTLGNCVRVVWWYCEIGLDQPVQAVGWVGRIRQSWTANWRPSLIRAGARVDGVHSQSVQGEVVKDLGNENVALSPLSIGIALSSPWCRPAPMAQRYSRSLMASSFHPATRRTSSPTSWQLWRSQTDRKLEVRRVASANRVLVEQSIKLKPAFQKTLKHSYGSDVGSVDFKHKVKLKPTGVPHFNKILTSFAMLNLMLQNFKAIELSFSPTGHAYEVLKWVWSSMYQNRLLFNWNSSTTAEHAPQVERSYWYRLQNNQGNHRGTYSRRKCHWVTLLICFDWCQKRPKWRLTSGCRQRKQGKMWTHGPRNKHMGRSRISFLWAL